MHDGLAFRSNRLKQNWHLALQAPVAGDLRAIIGAIQNVADVDRMGALALLHVAKIARRRHPGRALPEEVNGDPYRRRRRRVSTRGRPIGSCLTGPPTG